MGLRSKALNGLHIVEARWLKNERPSVSPWRVKENWDLHIYGGIRSTAGRSDQSLNIRCIPAVKQNRGATVKQNRFKDGKKAHKDHQNLWDLSNTHTHTPIEEYRDSRFNWTNRRATTRCHRISWSSAVEDRHYKGQIRGYSNSGNDNQTHISETSTTLPPPSLRLALTSLTLSIVNRCGVISCPTLQ